MLLLLTLWTYSIHAQESQPKTSHQSIFVQLFQTKQVANSDFLSSEFEFGIALGVYQHFDLGARLQLRLGGGLAYYKVDELDYTIRFGMDPDHFRSYVRNRVDIVQLNLPVNVRYKILGEANHLFFSGGFEGSIVLHDEFTTSIGEYLGGEYEIDHSPFIESRRLKVAGQLELGYECNLGNQKLNISLFGKYGFSSQFDGDAGQWAIQLGKPLDIGLGLGLIL